LLSENESLSPAKLARLLAVTAPNITAWLAKLESRSLISRSISDTDRRAHVITITQEGRRLSSEATSRLTTAEHSEFTELSSEEFETLQLLLQKFIAVKRGATRE